MAGNKNGKSKKQQQKKKEKSNPQKSNPKVDLGPKEGEKIDRIFGNNVDDEKEIERLIYKKLERSYKEVCNMLLALKYNSKIIQKAMLGGGYIIGDGNVVSNILKNSFTYINSCPVVDGEYVFKKFPIFNSMVDLIMFWVEELVNFAVQMYPDDSKCEAMRHILSCKLLDIERVFTDETEFDVLLKKNIHIFEGISLTCSSVVASCGKKNDASSSSTVLVNPQKALHHPQITCAESNQSSKDLEFDQLSLNPFESLPKGLDEEKSFEDLLRNSSADEKDELILKLENLVVTLEKQIMECKEWAKRKEREAFEMEKQDILELNMLRKEKLLGSSEGFKKEKNEFITTMIAEMLKKELDRDKESDKLAHLNEKMKTLELENSEIRADVSALKITEEEIKRNLKEAVKKEKEELKRIGNSEKQICKFQGHIHEEKEKIIQLDHQLHLVNEAQKEIKLKLKHEQEGREKANSILLKERRLTRIAKENVNNRLASLKQSLEMEQKLAMDHKMRLMCELSDLMMPHLLSNENEDSSSSSSSSHVQVLEEGEMSSQENAVHEQVETIPEHRRCVFCLQREVCILFMPCVHLVVCYGCSTYVRKDCPCCQVKIEKKIRVYGGDS